MAQQAHTPVEMETKAEPKRRNLAETKARILDSAASTFTTLGYAQAGLREIADGATFAPSLVSKHFGAKAALFEQALLHVIATNSVFTWDKVDFGRKMARLIAERSTTNITVMLVLAIADPESNEIATRVSRTHMIAPLREWLGPPHAEARAMDLFALMTGFVIQMHGLNRGEIPEHSLGWVADTLQGIVDHG
jgi:AcrR family transcriptional regulator